jgi:vanillate O-demethylase ferredoxin subunit
MTTDLLDVVVNHRELQGQGVAVLTLADPAGAALPAFSAGAHVDLHLPGGLVRSYSLCGDPRDRSAYRLGVLKDPASRGGSLAVHQALAEGTRLRIGAPRNLFPLAEAAPHSVLVGGGIGITPMLAMAWSLHAAGSSFELHYCARSRTQAAFLMELAAAPWVHHVSLHFDDEGEAARLAPHLVAQASAPGSHVYVCGPAGFMDWVLAESLAGGVAPERLHREYFSAPASNSADNLGFELVAQRSGKTLHVAPDTSLLAALKSLGISVPVSCEQGVCGTCACTVLAGEPEHRDAYLTVEERAANDQILVCCSRARSARLVLDL